MRTWRPEAGQEILDLVGPIFETAGFHRSGDWYQRGRGQLTDSVWFKTIKYDPDGPYASVDVRFGIYIGEVEKIDFGLSAWHPEGPPCTSPDRAKTYFAIPIGGGIRLTLPAP